MPYLINSGTAFFIFKVFCSYLGSPELHELHELFFYFRAFLNLTDFFQLTINTLRND